MPAKKQPSLNLLPQDEFDSSIKGRILKWILGTFRTIVIFVELIVIIGFLTRFGLDVSHANLNDEIEQKEAIIHSYSDLENNFKLAQKKLQIFSLASAPKSTFSPLLAKVSSHLPAELQLISLTKKENVIEIQVASISEFPVNQLIANLRTEPELSTLAITQIESTQKSSLTTYTLKTKS